MMKIQIAWIVARGRDEDFEAFTARYEGRLQAYVAAQSQAFRSEEAFWAAVEGFRGRTAPVVVLLDGRGKMFSSKEFAGWIGRLRESGTQQLVLAVGPADGWSEDSRRRAGMLLSLGPMTLPHGLARVVLAEQVYRAFTILAGHPYHRA